MPNCTDREKVYISLLHPNILQVCRDYVFCSSASNYYNNWKRYAEARNNLAEVLREPINSLGFYALLDDVNNMYPNWAFNTDNSIDKTELVVQYMADKLYSLFIEENI